MSRLTTVEGSAFASCQSCAWASDGWGNENDRKIAARLHVEQTGHRVSLEIQRREIVGPS